MSRLAKRPKNSHVRAAARLRANPGQWQIIGDYRSSQSADHMAYTIRTAFEKPGQSSPYAPAGSFQAYTRLTEDGSRLFACYVGERGNAQ
jgi:hypothetical protein